MPTVSSPVTPAAHRLAPWRATAVLVFLLAVGGWILFSVQHAPRRISVDVLELLPRDEQDPTIRLARQTVSGRFGRTLYIALHDTAHSDRAPVEAAALVAGELRANPVGVAAAGVVRWNDRAMAQGKGTIRAAGT